VEEQQRIFDRFGRAADVGAVEGSGLGLAIVLAIVEAHGGRVDVSSSAGAGATFTITLPLAGDDDVRGLEQEQGAARQEARL
jgi:two-component system OmpR family sensor kinase